LSESDLGLTLEDFQFELSQSLVAKRPLSPRGTSRLMVLDRAAQGIGHSNFDSIASYMEEGDCVVLNETRVMPCRLTGTRADTGGRVELLFVRRRGDSSWEVLVRPARRFKEGAELTLEGGATVHTAGRISGASFLIRAPEPFEEYMEKWGQMPIPPYIKRRADAADREDYQTVYAKTSGSCAAPTAGLHFTNETLRRLAAKGIETARVLLHVGPGTFKPLKPGPIASQSLDLEYFEVSAEACRVVNRARARGGRVFAVGTSTARVLETLVTETPAPVETGGAEGIGRGGKAPSPDTTRRLGDVSLRPRKGWAGTFIYPPYSFRVVDALITNFHLPGSSVLLLACAFAGREFILSAYEEAKKAGYRFYSYGDSMLIL
jgi:S-adenosylmethionine:tRNA ribosyltransferase-isomerase